MNRKTLFCPADARRRRTAGRWVLTVLGALILVWGLLPMLINGFFGLFTLLPAVLGALLLWWGRPAGEKPRGWRRVVSTVLIVCVCLAAALGTVLSALMIGAAVTRPAREDATVIVLGAKVNGDRPSRMLADRLNAAAAYLDKHPQAACVVSGGQGSDEAYSEASVMQKYLVEKGIDPARIYLEDRSTNTHENLENSLQLIRQEGLCDTVVIATQVFHQYRAATLARWADAAGVGAVPCRSPLHLVLYYWTRECAAICRLWLLHY